VNINHKEYQNRTPIYLAAFEGNLSIVDYLYSKGANPEMESKLSRTPLSKACYLGNVSVAEYLIKIGVNLTTIDSKGRTALHNAAWGIEGGRDGKKRGNIKLEDSP
jgi:ankyrin repeat protein